MARTLFASLTLLCLAAPAAHAAPGDVVAAFPL